MVDVEAKVLAHTITKDKTPYTLLEIKTPENFNFRLPIKGHHFTVGKKVKIDISAIV